MTIPTARPIALIGLMGAGKSAVARQLGERFGLPVADLDAMLEAEEGRAITEMFAREGEPWFRARELELLRRALAAGAGILACGGGVVVDPDARALLQESCVAVWLEVTPAEAARRMGKAAAERPLLAGGPPEARLAALLEQRRVLYEAAAQLRVATDGRAPAEVADAVAAALEALA